MPETRRTYTTIEVATRLGVSLQTVQRWVDAGHLQAWKTLGGHRRIEAHSAERLFQSQSPVRLDEPSALAGKPRPATKSSVVIADDDPIDRELLSRLVRKALPAATIEMADNGFQALVMIGRAAPSVVVTDIQMPHMNGFEMIRNLLLDGSTRPRTLIAVSAHSAEDLAALGRLPDEVQFFTKPVDERQFISALRQANAT